MASELKRRKIDEPPCRGNLLPSDAKNRTAAASASGSLDPVAQTSGSGINFVIQQAKYFAAAQAQEDGCTGNYRIFDSPFGNFLVPVIPTRAELAQ